MNRSDVYESVTNEIIKAIEAGAGDWQMPWHRSGISRPVNALTKRTYRGVNVVALWATADATRYTSGYWASYKQWQELGGQVSKGEKATLIVFWKKLEREIESDETDERETRRTLFARASWVFNADQVEGWAPPQPAVCNSVEVLNSAETFVSATGATIHHHGDGAYYRLSTDEIWMPERERFTGSRNSTATEAYYATLLHELTHWTGHESRLSRDLSGRFGNEAYAIEELVAELGAAFLCADLSITNTPRPDRSAYIANWLKVLKRDKRAIFTAASMASQAADHLFSLQPRREIR